jgi:N-sulfoglucosamine sulfohydrolase
MHDRCSTYLSMCLCLATSLGGLTVVNAEAADTPARRPNILWIVSEDNGPLLSCYGHPDANTPRLDKLATEGVLFRNAFANAPVCAPARCTIITGVYPPSLGTQHMRSKNFVPRERIPFFTHYLREAGYYCTNNSKTDYNLSPYQDEAWDMMQRGNRGRRKPGQPFFAVHNTNISHESSLHRNLDMSLGEADVVLPPYHPDTPEIRANWAMYHQIITRMDAKVGELLDELDEEGVADDTIVLYYADHGGILTRSKRFLFDTGVHVPMIARFGKNFAHLAPSGPGSETDRLVSFVDLAPTMLSLAGVKIPAHLQGGAFLGPQAAKPRDYVYCFRGRMDERYDFSRAVRDKRFKYIRNYNPHRIYGQHLEYLWKMPATRSWEAEYLAGRCEGPQRFFWETKAPEELYDTAADPWEVNNLADDPKCAEKLERMRAANQAHLLRIRDSGFLHESEFAALSAGSSMYDYVRDDALYPLERILSAAETATSGDLEQPLVLERMLGSDIMALRYWGAVGCAVIGEAAEPLQVALTERLEDESESVRIAAAEALLRLGGSEPAMSVLVESLGSKNPYAALQAANVLEANRELAAPALPALQRLSGSKKVDPYVQRAITHTIERLSQK